MNNGVSGVDMGPRTGRLAYNLAFVVLIFALIPLFFLEVNSPEFVVAMLTLIFDSLFIFLVTFEVRRQVKNDLSNRV